MPGRATVIPLEVGAGGTCVTHRQFGGSTVAGCQRDTVGRAHVDPAADLVAHLEHALGRVTADSEPLKVPPTTYSREEMAVVSRRRHLRLVLGRDLQRPAVRRLGRGRRGGRDLAVVHRWAAASATAGVAASGGGSGSASRAATASAVARDCQHRHTTNDHYPNAFPEDRPPPDAGWSDPERRTTCGSLPANRTLRDSQRYASVTRPNSVSPASSG